jgi:hypothetical protein
VLKQLTLIAIEGLNLAEYLEIPFFSPVSGTALAIMSNIAKPMQEKSPE